MSNPSEKSLVKKILAYLKSIPGCYARKRHGGAFNPGEPDITGCLEGWRLEFEVKLEGNPATPRQRAELRRWEAAGSITGVVHSVDEVKEVLREHGLPS